jgi:hypothetical protein
VNCLDAETLAAWFDDGLSGAALEDVRAHVATCVRCQALVGAMGRTSAAAPSIQPERTPRWWLAWAVPAAAAATAIAIWVAVPHPPDVAVTSAPAPSLQKQDAQRPSTPSRATPAQAKPVASPPAPATPTLQDRARSAEAAPRAAAAPSANDATEQTPAPLNEAVSVRPEPPPDAERREDALRQGAIAGQLQTRALFATPLCGPMWPQVPADVANQISAGSAPSGDVCWLVGRAGTVLLSTDHQSWQRVNIPEAVDLSRVTATDARTATVIAADGRTFSTADGGVTWRQP